MPFRLIFLSVAGVLAVSLPATASGELWSRWPAGREDYEPSCGVPPGFVDVNPLVQSRERIFLNARFRSEEAPVEFAVAALYARSLPPTLEARSIPLPLLPGERIVEREPRWKDVSVHGTEFRRYDEAITVQGPDGAYTRYFRLEVSTGSLPGSCTLLWEFKVADEKTRKAFQETYRQFKDGVNLGED